MLRTSTLTAVGILGVLAAGGAVAQDDAACIMRGPAIDLNADGMLTRDEMMAGRDQFFAQVDTNGDNLVDADEYATCYGLPLSAVDGSMTTPNTRTGWQLQAQTRFSGMDTDLDTVLSREEFLNGYEAQWSQIPLDAAGNVTTDAYITYEGTLMGDENSEGTGGGGNDDANTLGGGDDGTGDTGTDTGDDDGGGNDDMGSGDEGTGGG